MNTATTTGRDSARAGAFPGLGGSPSRFFTPHALLALVALLVLNVMIVTYIPVAIKGIGSSYLIFFYHFPSALNMALFYAGLLGASIFYLKTKDPLWDRRAGACAEVGLLCNAVLLLTGSTWAKAAWNVWWRWEDPRLMSAAVMSLIYLGYVMLARAIDEGPKRRKFSAVYGILAFANIPIVHFSIKWFGQVSHPMKFNEFSSDTSIVFTRWYAVIAFFLFYVLLYRWNFDRRALSERTESALQRTRRLEEARGL